MLKHLMDTHSCHSIVQIGEADLRKLIYCDFTDPKADTRHYLEVQDLDHLRNVTEGYLVEFNNMTKKPMNLVLFRYFIFFNSVCFSTCLFSNLIKCC